MRKKEFKNFIKFHQSDSRLPILGRFIDCDAGYFIGNRFCVADGVTRDFKNGDVLRLEISKKCLNNILNYFPHIKELKEVSDLFVKSFTLSNEKKIKKIIEEANHEIMEYYIGKRIGPNDYLGKNYLGITAAGGYIENEVLTAFNIGDSNIVVLDKFLDTIYKTEDLVVKNKEKREQRIEKLYNITDGVDNHWNENEFRQFFRKENINNPSNPYSYGILNGELTALNYVRYYNWPLIKEAMYVFAYTDGYEDVMKNKDGIKKLTLGKKVRTKKESTIIGYRRK